MRPITRKFATRLLFLACAAAMAPGAMAQRGEEEPPATIDQRTGEALNEAIEFLNMDQYDQAREVLADLNLERLSPFERGRVEQILATIEYGEGNFPASRQHMQAALNSGGLSEVEISQVRYQIAQMYMAEENWVEGARALEEWIAAEEAPNSAAYYLLAAAYYQQELFDKSLPNARKAVELTDMPQEPWLQLLQALLLQKEEYEEAKGVLKMAVNLYPDKKVYWLQLSSVYSTLEEYSDALAVLSIAHLSGLLTEGSDIRRLADLMMVQGTPNRAAELLTANIESGVLEPDGRLYETLANAWVAAREYEKSLPVLRQAAELSDDGDLFVRLGEVNIQLEDWPAATDALQDALDKGDVRDEPRVHLLLGIAFYNQDKLEEAVPWLERAATSDDQEKTATAYLQLIESRNG